ncbi:MAG: hypothetical protein BJ554DRAFT_7008 [Olpidium bornovanus]|uniref:Uncharacterized protein n=1 Tax=Olpidium bornovanus TaxID=278681 RepID=A0A8H7ZXM5_9FUNG|nr:MAG: hypothetical protein BJ554DRAFT_7008 [Olpidium bornovanus]
MAVPAEYGPRCLQLRDFLADRGSWKLAEPEYIIGCLQVRRRRRAEGRGGKGLTSLHPFLRDAATLLRGGENVGGGTAISLAGVFPFQNAVCDPEHLSRVSFDRVLSLSTPGPSSRAQAARALGVRRGYSAQAGAALFDAVVKVLQQGIDADALDDETKGIGKGEGVGGVMIVLPGKICTGFARIFVWAREMHGIVSSEGIVGSHQESQGGFRTVSPMAASTVPVATVGLPNSPRATFSSVLPSRYNAFGQQIAQGAPRLVGSPQTQILPVTHAPTATTGLPTPRNAPARECSPRGARHDGRRQQGG